MKKLIIPINSNKFCKSINCSFGNGSDTKGIENGAKEIRNGKLYCNNYCSQTKSYLCCIEKLLNTQKCLTCVNGQYKGIHILKKIVMVGELDGYKKKMITRYKRKIERRLEKDGK